MNGRFASCEPPCSANNHGGRRLISAFLYSATSALYLTDCNKCHLVGLVILAVLEGTESSLPFPWSVCLLIPSIIKVILKESRGLYVIAHTHTYMLVHTYAHMILNTRKHYARIHG